jgi:uncharacterized protein (TIGR03435 family)
MSIRIARSLIAVIGTASAFSQAPPPTEFEVASVRPNTLNDRIVAINVGPGDRFTARGYTLVLMMQRAYGVMDWNVSSGPGWIRSDRFDVSAKAPVTGNLAEQQLRPMLQALLAERFKLKLHKTTKEMSGYALVVAKGGPKVKPSADGEPHPDNFRFNATGLSFQGITMEDLARYVTGKLSLVGVDHTGLKGLYDAKADWTVDPEPGADPRDNLRAAVFAALQDQLGLKLAPQKITIQMLVIDSVDKPSEN